MGIGDQILQLDHTPSHRFELDIEARRAVQVSVDVECDRDNPMCIRLEGATRFSPALPLSFQRPALRAKFFMGSDADIARLKANSEIMSLMKGCVRNSFHNVTNPSVHLTLIPDDEGARCTAMRMPKPGFLWLADEIGVRKFLRLLDRLDDLGTGETDEPAAQI